MWTINDFPAYGMVSGWSTHGKLACSYCMAKQQGIHANKQRSSFFLFYCHYRFLPTNHMHKKNKKDFFIGIVKKDVAPLRLFGEELHDVVSEYGDIVFGFQSDK